MALPFQKQGVKGSGRAEAVFWRLYCLGYTIYLSLALFPGPRTVFLSFVVWLSHTASNRKLGEGLGTRLTLDYSC